MKKSIICEKMRRGEPVLVTKQNFFNPDMAELIGYSGFDAIWLCNEHIMMDRSLLANILRTSKISGIDMLVRLSASADYTDLIQPLESGAQGLMIPHVHDVEQLKWIVHECKFHPLGLRGMDCVNQDCDQGFCSVSEYIKFANENTFIVAQIEDEEALAKVDEMAAVPGIDVIFIGPMDFSQAIGHPGEPRHPDVQKAILRCAEACARHGKYCGTPSFGPDHAKELVNSGVKFVTASGDYSILRNGFKELRRAYGDTGLFTFRDYQP